MSVLLAEKSNVDTLPGAQQFVHKVPVSYSSHKLLLVTRYLLEYEAEFST